MHTVCVRFLLLSVRTHLSPLGRCWHREERLDVGRRLRQADVVVDVWDTTKGIAADKRLATISLNA